MSSTNSSLRGNSDTTTTSTAPPPPSDPPSPARTRRSRGWIWLLLFALIAALAFGAYRMRGNAQAQSSSRGGRGQGGTPEVSLAPVVQKDMPLYLHGLTGTVTAYNTVTIKSRVDGQIIQVAFHEGQFVKQGELLVQIDPRPFQVALDQAVGQLAKDQAQLNEAKLDAQRDEGLWKEGIIPRQQLDVQNALVGQFQGTIKSDQAAIDNQRLQLTYCRITAPIAGRIGLRLMDEGNIIHANDANGIVVITQLQPIAVLFPVPEGSLPDVAKQMRVHQLKVEAHNADDTSKLADGKLLTVDNEIDQTTGTVRLKAEFQNSDTSLWPNQFVNIWLLLDTRHNAMVIPSAAIQHGAQNRTFVYVVDPAEKKAQDRTVQIDFVAADETVIKGGLNLGEQVVTDGQDKLSGGVTVDIRQPGGGRGQGGAANSSGSSTGSGQAPTGTGQGQPGRPGGGQGKRPR